MKIPNRAKKIMEVLHEAGARDMLIVGGFVRDGFLGLESKDVDIEVYGMTIDEIAAVLRRNGMRVDAVGKAFGVLKVNNEIDVSVPRRENKIGVGHRGFDVVPDPGMSVEGAASRRDFTINSMAIRMDGTIIDPHNGRVDLDVRCLRATSPGAFVEDPLRVMRAMQFASRFRMWIHPDTEELCRSMSPQKAELPKERVWEEWKKWALKGKKPSLGLKLLIDTGWADPEIQDLVDVPQDATWHPEGTVDIHSGHVVDAATEIADREQLDDHDRLVLMFAALTHDFGKPSTTKMEGGRWRSGGHCEAGVGPAERFLMRIGAPFAVIAEVKPLIAEHLVHAGIKDPTPKAIRRLANRIAPASIQALGRVVEADHSGRPPLPKGNPLQSWVDKAAELNVYSAKPEAILMGRHLIEMGVSPGKKMGVLLARAFEAQLDGDFDNLEDAQQWARNHMDWVDVHMGS